MPGAANITTAAGDIAVFYEYASADWRCLSYTAATGKAVVETEITLGTEQTPTSVTEIELSAAIPAGTKRITVTFQGVSLDASSGMLIQIGDSGGYHTTGYVSASSQQTGTVDTSTAGFVMRSGGSANILIHGLMTLVLSDETNNTWVSSHTMSLTGTNGACYGGGYTSLDSDIDRLKVTTVGGTANFDAGSFNIIYE